eukprot:c20322_g1_i1.p1 GENE.c20322_g1_i1~~c20322_g1_i1.p1  ORF type:complete len:557 (-),score=68.22 c20322_g1_i1:21-1691(-)
MKSVVLVFTTALLFFIIHWEMWPSVPPTHNWSVLPSEPIPHRVLEPDWVSVETAQLMDQAEAQFSRDSHLSWGKPAFGSLPFRVCPMAVSIDVRPSTIAAQVKSNPKSPVGCAVVGWVAISPMQVLLANAPKMVPQCALAIGPADNLVGREFVASGLGSIDSNGVVVVPGVAAAHAAGPFLKFQQNMDGPAHKHAFPWEIECVFPNHMLLTCEKLSVLQGNVDFINVTARFGVQTNLKAPKLLVVTASWPWGAARTPNDSRRFEGLTRAHPTKWGLRLGLVQGPVYSASSNDTTEVLVDRPQGGVHDRFVTHVLTLAYSTFGFVNVIGVPASQFKTSLIYLEKLLDTPLWSLVPRYCERQVSRFDCHLPLRHVLEACAITIRLVAWPLTAWTVKTLLIAGQYAFDRWIVVRHAADFDVMAYFDGDATLVTNQVSLKDFFFDQFFTPGVSCWSVRLTLIERSVKEANHDLSLGCAIDFAGNASLRAQIVPNCSYNYGNVVARTDTLRSLDVHHVFSRTLGTTADVRDHCPFLTLPPEHVFELHLTPKTRAPTCTCPQ